MRAYHFMPGEWMLMVHGDVDLYYDHQGTVRGDDQVGSTNWFMVMAMRRIATLRSPVGCATSRPEPASSRSCARH